ncbi:MAG: cell division protein FtsZ [Verrucomicrobiales bacterium]
MIEYKQDEKGGDKAGEGFSVRVIGIGGAGANSLDRIALEGMEGADLLAMNTDVRALSTSVSGTKIQLGKELTKGLGAGGDPELGREAAVEAADEIRKVVADQSIIFICVGLGGGTGSGAAPVIARIAEQTGAFVVVFATFPFSFEGRRRIEQARSALAELASCANAVMVFENDRMGELILAKEGIQKAFAAADKIISQSVRAVTQLVTKAGLIHIGLDDLMSALRNTDSRCLFGFGRSKGQNRAQAAVKQALRSPLLDRGQLAQAKNVLVHICGGESMTLYEVELLMKELGKNLRDDAQIFFGTATDPGMGDDVGVTVITSLEHGVGSQDKDEAVEGENIEAASETEELEVTAAEDEEAVVSSEPDLGGEDDFDDIGAEAEDEADQDEEQEEKTETVAAVAKVVAKGKAALKAVASRREAPPREEPAGAKADADDAPEDKDEEVVASNDRFRRVEKSKDAVALAGDDDRGDAVAGKEDDEGSSPGRGRKKTSQAELSLNPGARGRFEKAEPTIVDGEDLDVPTFLRGKD